MKKILLDQAEIEVIELNARGRDILSRVAYVDISKKQHGAPKFGFNNISYWGWLAEYAVAKYLNIYPDITWALNRKTKHYDLVSPTGALIDVKRGDFYDDTMWVRPKSKSPDHYVYCKMKRHELVRDNKTGRERRELLEIPEFYLYGHTDINRFHKRAFFHRKSGAYGISQDHLLKSFPKNIFGDGAGS